MKLRKFIPLVIILVFLWLSATTITADNDGLRAIGFFTGVFCGYTFCMWLYDNL